jgi:ketosteroid isomerase-like protein
MTNDHLFIDSWGNKTEGKVQMKSGWTGYFQLFPDYTIEIYDVLIHGTTVAVFGFAGGTFRGGDKEKGNYWHLPAAWKAIVKKGKIHLWQVYADSKIPYDIITKITKQR